MTRTQLLQEIRKMRFEEAYAGWNAGRLTQEEAARILGVCERSFRRYLWKYEAQGSEGLIDRRLEPVSNRQAPVDELIPLHHAWAGQRAVDEIFKKCHADPACAAAYPDLRDRADRFG